MQFLLDHAPQELILIFMPIESANIDLLLDWFNRSVIHIIRKCPHETAFFVQRLFKKITLYKSLGLLLALVDEPLNTVNYA